MPNECTKQVLLHVSLILVLVFQEISAAKVPVKGGMKVESSSSDDDDDFTDSESDSEMSEDDSSDEDEVSSGADPSDDSGSEEETPTPKKVRCALDSCLFSSGAYCSHVSPYLFCLFFKL